MKTPTSTIGIDRGSKYIGLAYVREGNSIPLPIGYMLNDSMLFYSIGDIIARYHTNRIVLGYPSKQKDVQEKIQGFVHQLRMIISPDIEIEFIEEDYTSVQSGEIVSNFKKNVAVDTVSAMLILERWMKPEDTAEAGI